MENIAIITTFLVTLCAALPTATRHCTVSCDHQSDYCDLKTHRCRPCADICHPQVAESHSECWSHCPKVARSVLSSAASIASANDISQDDKPLSGLPTVPHQCTTICNSQSDYCDLKTRQCRPCTDICHPQVAESHSECWTRCPEVAMSVLRSAASNANTDVSSKDTKPLVTFNTDVSSKQRSVFLANECGEKCHPSQEYCDFKQRKCRSCSELCTSVSAHTRSQCKQHCPHFDLPFALTTERGFIAKHQVTSIRNVGSAADRKQRDYNNKIEADMCSTWGGAHGHKVIIITLAAACVALSLLTVWQCVMSRRSQTESRQPGQVGNVITNKNASRQEFERLRDGTKAYMRNNNVPQDIQRRVQRCYDYAWSRGRMNGGGDINSSVLLPDQLKTDLAVEVNFETLKHVTIFRECEPAFLRDLVLKMRKFVFAPGDLICQKGEVAREMFIIADGLLEVISDSTKAISHMSAGNFLGEIGILNLDGGVNRRTANVRSVGYSELFVLSRDDVLSALKDYPEAKAILSEEGRKRLHGIRQDGASLPKSIENNLGTSALESRYQPATGTSAHLSLPMDAEDITKHLGEILIIERKLRQCGEFYEKRIAELETVNAQREEQIQQLTQWLSC